MVWWGIVWGETLTPTAFSPIQFRLFLLQFITIVTLYRCLDLPIFV